MLKVARLLVGASALVALSAYGSLALAQPAHDSAYLLGRSIASAAASAERTVNDPVAVQGVVRNAVQNVIIGAADEPTVVLAALDSALSACRAPAGRTSSEWTCPASPGSYAALNGLRGLVVAQLEQTDPAALAPLGTAAFGSITSSAASANYSSF